MAKAQLKTKQNSASVEDFLNSIKDEEQKKDAKAIDALMRSVTKEKPKMWGSSIVGYGLDHLKYASGRELDWMKIGFSPRKQNLTLYICNGGIEKYQDLLDKLGKHATGKGCLYIKRLADIDRQILQKIIKRSVDTN